MNLTVTKAEDCSYIKLFDNEDLAAFRAAGFPGS